MEENKIWANLNDSYNLDVILIENEALKNFVPKKEIIKPDQPKSQVQNIDMEQIINNIISQDFTNYNILDILNKQNIIASNLLKLFRSTKLDDITWNKFRPGLDWILQTSKFLSSKSGLFAQLFKTDKIYRSSYKFCNRRDECEALYCEVIGSKSRNLSRCNGDHYVHNKLVSDLTCLIAVLDKRICDSSLAVISNDLRVCLDTINFVVNHMYNELNVFNIYNSQNEGFNINKYYVTSFPKRK